MKYPRYAAALLVALPLSTFVAACGQDEDSGAREALEQEALERDLELALEPDTTVEPELADVPVEEPPVVAETPPPAPRPVARAAEAPRRSTPRPEARRREPAPSAPREPEGPRYVTRTAPAGSSFSVRLDRELSSRSVGPGETFTATLTEPLVSSDGSTVIPAGATVRGRVTDVRVSERAGQRAGISVAFTSISYGGETYPIDATVTDSPPVRRVTRDSNLEKAGKVAGGAALGGIIGRAIGKDTKSTVAGAAIGAAAGTAVAIGTAQVDAVISAGSTATVRLDSPVRVRKKV